MAYSRKGLSFEFEIDALKSKPAISELVRLAVFC